MTGDSDARDVPKYEAAGNANDHSVTARITTPESNTRMRGIVLTPDEARDFASDLTDEARRVDGEPDHFPGPGIYLLNATGDLTPLATEDGGGDRQLLREGLAEHAEEHEPAGVDVDDDGVVTIRGTEINFEQLEDGEDTDDGGE